METIAEKKKITFLIGVIEEKYSDLLLSSKS